MSRLATEASAIQGASGVRFGKPINVTVIQVYAPTTGADDEEIEDFYVSLQQLVDATPKKIPLSSWAIGTPK
ncbi:unnamed protein product [Rotaria magnacalcarata]|uniref:Uncharacterized protein n=1 Tax=Rotaria magnacalcarata TaxID=392030 RepID=A0A814MXA7_9BILA|nr:unnamed protein product [Rotaria magnacalcarata]